MRRRRSVSACCGTWTRKGRMAVSSADALAFTTGGLSAKRDRLLLAAIPASAITTMILAAVPGRRRSWVISMGIVSLQRVDERRSQKNRRIGAALPAVGLLRIAAQQGRREG